MTATPDYLHQIEDIAARTLDVLESSRAIPGFHDRGYDDFHQICHNIPRQISEGFIKIAVVGVIKSGKSTLVNALTGKELVRRGAGAMTSITTRIRKGKKNQATVYFKSWDRINYRIEAALAHFPEDTIPVDKPSGFDMRRQADRSYLSQVYRQMVSYCSQSGEPAGPETLLVQHALSGYDSCYHRVQADETDLVFSGKSFAQHKTFTSDAGRAFYVRDVLVEIYGKSVLPHIEIADCQGADSTDPASLEQVTTYLEQANLIIYCISSRNGLRQADVTFLKQIKKMGLMDHVLFVNNCDLTEHDTIDDLKKIESAIRNDLSLVTEQLELFSFSSLYQLFAVSSIRLKAREKHLLEFWQKERAMTQYCDEQFEAFSAVLQNALNTFRLSTIGGNHLGRLTVVMSKLYQRSALFLDLLSSGAVEKQAAHKQLEQLNLNASRLESIVSNSIDAAVKGLKSEILDHIDTVFSNDKLGVMADTRRFILQVPVDVEQYRISTQENTFNHILYMMFQDFRRELDRYLLENIQPVIHNFVKELESKIESHFQSLLDSYQIDLIKSGFEADFKLAIAENSETRSAQRLDFVRIKDILGLTPPLNPFKVSYSSKIKAGLFADFSLTTFTGIFSALFGKKKVCFSPGLKKAAHTLKRQASRLLSSQQEQYRNDLKHLYFIPVIEAGAREFQKIIHQRFQDYQSLRSQIEALIDQKAEEKNQGRQKVVKIKKQTAQLRQELADLQAKSGSEQQQEKS